LYAATWIPHLTSPDANYSAVETLRNGIRLQIRALRPDDRNEYLAAVNRVGSRSLYRRFFAPRRNFTEREESFYVNVDFVDHVALIALVEDNGQSTIVGGGRYVRTQPRQAEVAFTVIDQYHGQGIGSALLRHLAGIARKNDINELIAQVLPENGAMLKVFETSGLRVEKTRDADAIHVTLALA
jgi:RimJ/RimL family protein N-acetyltransferase